MTPSRTEQKQKLQKQKMKLKKKKLYMQPSNERMLNVSLSRHWYRKPMKKVEIRPTNRNPFWIVKYKNAQRWWSSRTRLHYKTNMFFAVMIPYPMQLLPFVHNIHLTVNNRSKIKKKNIITNTRYEYVCINTTIFFSFFFLHCNSYYSCFILHSLVMYKYKLNIHFS